MTKEQLLFSLLRSQINDEPIDLSDVLADTELLQQTLQLARRHNITHLVGQALVKNGLSSDHSLFSYCENYVMMEMANDSRRTYAIDCIQSLFDKNQIAYILLKGAVVRWYYPESWMRNSCDIDVLIHREEMKRAIELLTNELHYIVVHNGVHDVTLFHGEMHLELHFDLIEEGRAKQATSVLDDIWTYAWRQEGSYASCLPNEWFYFYHIAHMAKHMTNGGCGIRSFIDVWVLNQSCSYDEEKRRELLEKGGLSVFAHAVEYLAEVWFSNAEHSALSKELETFVINSGTYGSNANRIMLTKINFGDKTSYFLPRLFMPYRLMKLKYPILEKHPILLPYFWVLRIGTSVFSKTARVRAKKEIRSASKIDTSAIDQTQRLMEQLDLSCR